MIVIFAFALIVFGPRRLPEIARTIGRSLGQFRRAASDLRETVEREVHADELRSSMEQVKETARQVSNVSDTVRRATALPSDLDKPSAALEKPAATTPATSAVSDHVSLTSREESAASEPARAETEPERQLTADVARDDSDAPVEPS